MSDHGPASRLSVLALALVFAGCGTAPSASPVGALPASPTVGAVLGQRSPPSAAVCRCHRVASAFYLRI